jgi:hypothetical protein
MIVSIGNSQSRRFSRNLELHFGLFMQLRAAFISVHLRDQSVLLGNGLIEATETSM